MAAAQAAYARAESEPMVMDTLGWLYLRKGIPDRAVALLENAHALDPTNTEIRYHLALAYRGADRIDEARELLSELREQTPTTHELYARIGEALAALP